jgi:hypothetical protein
MNGSKEVLSKLLDGLFSLNLEDRFYVPYRYVPLFVDSGWKQENA